VRMMQFGTLHPLELPIDRASVIVRGTKPRAVLALLLHADHTLRAERPVIAPQGEDGRRAWTAAF
jgi:DNA-binding SARP family transcriptional activator